MKTLSFLGMALIAVLVSVGLSGCGGSDDDDNICKRVALFSSLLLLLFIDASDILTQKCFLKPELLICHPLKWEQRN